MKRLLPTFAILFACAAIAWATAPTPLTTLRAVKALSNAEASQGLPVAFEATVTFVRPDGTSLYVQDGNDGILVRINARYVLAPGDRVLIKGKTQPGFRPIVIANSISVAGHASLPKPVPASFDELNRSEHYCERVTVRAVVQTTDVRLITGFYSTQIRLLIDGGTIDAWVIGDDLNPHQDMIDNEIEVTGIASGKLDGKKHHIGVKLDVVSFADIKIIKGSASNPWILPVTPMDKILDTYHVTNHTSRIRVQGTITYYQPGSALVLQNGNNSLWIMTNTETPLRVGNQADVTGFATLHDNYMAITSGIIRQSSIYTPIVPEPMSWHELPNSKHIFDLVSVEGLVLMEVRKKTQDEYLLVSEGQVFSAIYNHPNVDITLPLPMKQIPLGSMARVSGICLPLENHSPSNHDLPFNIMMRTPEDITVVARPSLLSIRNLMLMVGLLFAIMIVVGIRGWALERKVRRQTAALAALERRRGHILEDINGSRPLAEILEEITELVSFQLQGAPCWCEVTDGARLGNCPPQLATRRVAHDKIPARSGPPLGVISAAFDLHAKLSANESEALSMAAGLAALAIETRHLYSDLLHRSEFDMLTDIHNRFSLEKLLDAQIDKARLEATVFGLIYIDLDYFKLVNDSYGHQVGDLYLQDVALRLKRQLRPHDRLARLGGDEFAALVPVVRSRAEVEEIAQRLERSFDEPFAMEELILTGSASLGIALYPQDGATRDDLLNAADAAMYLAKNTKRQIENALPQSSPNS
jgi:diguanylate cyclase (GGDEF)-like protein